MPPDSWDFISVSYIFIGSYYLQYCLFSHLKYPTIILTLWLLAFAFCSRFVEESANLLREEADVKCQFIFLWFSYVSGIPIPPVLWNSSVPLCLSLSLSFFFSFFSQLFLWFLLRILVWCKQFYYGQKKC